jgi:hypothetical protein
LPQKAGAARSEQAAVPRLFGAVAIEKPQGGRGILDRAQFFLGEPQAIIEPLGKIRLQVGPENLEAVAETLDAQPQIVQSDLVTTAGGTSRGRHLPQRAREDCGHESTELRFGAEMAIQRLPLLPWPAKPFRVQKTIEPFALAPAALRHPRGEVIARPGGRVRQLPA